MQRPVPGCNSVPRVALGLHLDDVGPVVQDGGGHVGEVETLEDGRDVGAEAGGQAELLQGAGQQGGQRGGQGGLPAGTVAVTTEIYKTELTLVGAYYNGL